MIAICNEEHEFRDSIWDYRQQLMFHSEYSKWYVCSFNFLSACLFLLLQLKLLTIYVLTHVGEDFSVRKWGKRSLFLLRYLKWFSHQFGNTTNTNTLLKDDSFYKPDSCEGYINTLNVPVLLLGNQIMLKYILISFDWYLKCCGSNSCIA